MFSIFRPARAAPLQGCCPLESARGGLRLGRPQVSSGVDGKEAGFTPTILGPAKLKTAKRTSVWSADGSGFDAKETAVFEGPEGPDEVTGTRTWRLSPDGKVLTIVMDLNGGGGPIKSKRIFNRK